MPIDGDFVNLAKLRKALKIGSRDIPPDWNKACRNYLRSPLGKYTLCDLVSRYAVLKNSALDRFGKPEDAHKPDIFETMLAECGEENAGQKRICN